jgi:hypothetical protein
MRILLDEDDPVIMCNFLMSVVSEAEKGGLEDPWIRENFKMTSYL